MIRVKMPESILRKRIFLRTSYKRTPKGKIQTGWRQKIGAWAEAEKTEPFPGAGSFFYLLCKVLDFGEPVC
jgi:hypothetical protein